MVDFFGWVEKTYQKQLKKLLDNRIAAGGTLVLAFVISVLCLFARPGLNFFSSHAEKNYRIDLLYPASTPDMTKVKNGTQIAERVNRKKHFDHVMGRYGKGRNTIHIQSQNEIYALPLRITGLFSTVEHPEYFITPLTPINTLFGGSDRADLILTTTNPSLETLSKVNNQLLPLLKQIPGITGVRLRTGLNTPQINFELPYHRMQAAGVTRSMIEDSIKYYTEQLPVTELQIGNHLTSVFTQTTPPVWNSIDQFMNMPLLASPIHQGLMLSDVLDFNISDQALSILHEERRRVGEIAINTDGRSIEDIESQIASLSPLKDMRWELSPPELNIHETFGHLLTAMLFAIILIYVVLAIQFESVLYPFIILLSIPLASIGIILSLRITLFHYDIPAFIGSAILCGIVVNNAIMLIDTINSSRRAHMTKIEAIIFSAGSRLRPILMTTLTTVLAALPTAIISGTGSELYQSLSIVLVGGLCVSTFLTLFVIPLVYNIVDGLINRIDALLLRVEMGFKK